MTKLQGAPKTPPRRDKLSTTQHQRLEALIDQVREVALEIGFRPVRSGRRSRINVLAAELDARGIKPPRQPRPHERGWLCNWIGAVDTAALRRFLKTYLPELLTQDSSVVVNPVSKTVSKTVSNVPVSNPPKLDTPKLDTELDNGKLDTELDNGKLDTLKLDKPGRTALNISGWTVRQDAKGFYRAFKTVAGKTRCVYIGKSLVGAELKLPKTEVPS